MEPRLGDELIVQTINTSATIASNRLVLLDGSAYSSDATTTSYGISKYDTVSGENNALILQGSGYVEIDGTSGAFTLGAPVYAGATGKAKSTGTVIKGKALEAINPAGATVPVYVKVLLRA